MKKSDFFHSSTPKTDFELCPGWRDPEGRAHRLGRIRRVRPEDLEIARRDRRVRDDPARLPLVLLARVVIRLGEIEDAQVTPEHLEALTSRDYARLIEAYRRLPEEGSESERDAGEGPV